MKKHLLLSASLMATASLYATHYMHVNLDNGKEYDIKIEKTDRVSHIQKDSLKYIKVSRKDSTYSLYPLSHSKVNFDEEIAKMDSNVCDWRILSQTIGGCKLEQIGTPYDKLYLKYFEENAVKEKEYNNCIKKHTTLSQKELDYQSKANSFADQLLINIASDSSKNYIFSPTSMQLALGMLANGSDDNIYDEITGILGCSGIELDSVNNWYQRRMNCLKNTNYNTKIGVANAAWLQQGIRFGKNFMQNLQTYYSASTNNVDFGEDSSYTLMDKWANEVTDSMIPKMGVMKDPNLLLILANGLSFKSSWKQKFMVEKTAAGKFTTATGAVKQPMKMSQAIEGKYADTDKYQLTTLSLYSGFEMEVVLPKKDVNPKEILSNINWDNITYKTSPDTVYVVNLKLPKFSIDNKNNMMEVFHKMGLSNILEANYNKIAQDAQISQFAQLTHLEIDEEGAKGAAITYIGADGDNETPIKYKYFDMDVNRPFIVCLRNPNTREILFVGIINDPTRNSNE